MPPARAVFWAATLGGLVITARTVFLEPLPLATAVLCVAGYLAIILAGVLSLRLRMFADALIAGPSGARGVVLTFDDGPDPETTPKVLDLLEARKAKATFFVIGKKAEKHPELVKQIVERGHTIGVHGYAHDRLFSMRGPARVKADLSRAIAVLEKITGARPTLFRPPIGHTNPTIARIADRLDLEVVGWSVSARDGVKTKPEAAAARVARHVEDGAIVLLHDAAERGTHTPASIAALPWIFDALAARNLSVVPLASWLEEAAPAEAAR